jgi:hypothetical protein
MKLDNTTFRGLIAIIGAAAIIWKPDQIAVIVPAVLTLIGTINVVRNP